ncbi:TetR family transcriptional regulator [Zavarzinia compransoris]|uniref:TetR family transcriptional regulator n=1 Tax=Zavarzinia marina TaxID=2911065 RepID=UPI001F3D12FA|nr:TetR family transcriptional regulator [Zavarzinia marina]MCF4166608.1 TetR family transcriptional regulator [Zavarzinia marina]
MARLRRRDRDDGADTPSEAPTEKGQRTRRALADAALSLLSDGRGFEALSLREVTRRAGVVPAAFYRHFKDMEDLGLTIVDDCGRLLREMLREVRQARLPTDDTVRQSVMVFWMYVRANPQYFRIAANRYGRNSAMGRAIRGEVDLFVDEMAKDVRAQGTVDHLSEATLRNVCSLVVHTMLNAAVDILEATEADPAAARRLVEDFVQQVQIIFIGANAWRDAMPEETPAP